VPASRTLEGVRQGRDEILEKAMGVVRARVTTPADRGPISDPRR